MPSRDGALDEIQAEIAFHKGMDVATHEYLVPQDRFDLLQNVEQVRHGALRKRQGRVLLPTDVHRFYDEKDDEETTIPVPSFSGPIDNGEALMAHGDELLLFDGAHAFTRMKAQDEWSFRSNHAQVLCKSFDVAAGDETASMVQAAYTNGYRMVAWQSGTVGGVRYSVQEVATGAYVVPISDVEGISAALTALRLLAVGNKFVLLWTDGAATIRSVTLDTVTIADGQPHSDPTLNLIADVRTSNGFFDAVPGNPGTFYVAFPDNTSTITVKEFSPGSTTATRTVTFGTAPSEAISIFIDPDAPVATDVFVADAHDNATNVVINLAVYDTLLGTAKKAHGVVYTETGATGRDVPQIVVGPGASTGSVLIMWNLDSATQWYGDGHATRGTQPLDSPAPVGQLQKLDGVLVENASPYTITQEFMPIYNAALVSKPVKYVTAGGDGSVLFVVANDPRIQVFDDANDDYYDDNTLDACFGLMRWERVGEASSASGPFRETWPEVCGVWRPGTAGGPRAVWGSTYTGRNDIGALVEDETTGNWIFGMAVAARVAARVDPDTRAHVSDNRPAIGMIDTASYTERYANTAAGSVRLIGGGMAHIYDRHKVTDLGFLWRPVMVPEAHPFGAAVVHLSGVYEWTDAEGRTHQSTPAVPSAATTRGAMSACAYTWTPRKVRLAQYQRHTDGVYYREPYDVGGAGRLYPGLAADRDVASGLVAMSVISYPSPINEHQPLYTTGSVLPNEAGPSFIDVAEWENRVWGVSAEKPNELWFSKELVENEGVAFSAFLRQPVGQEHEPIVAIQPMDAWMVVFKKNRIYMIQGQPPNDLGQGSSLRVQEIATDVGCKSAKSVVLSPKGVFFQSRKGLYLLGRGAQVQYVGHPVDSSILGTYLVTSAVLVPEFRSIRFTFDAYSTIVVYNYLYDTWQYHTIAINLAEPGPAVMWDDPIGGSAESTYVLLAQNGNAYHDSATAYEDDTTFFAMRVRTSWLRMKSLQGYERFWKLLLLGRRLGRAELQATLEHDRDGAVVDTKTFEWEQIDATPPIAAGSDRVQLELRPSRQRSQAIRLDITDVTIKDLNPDPPVLNTAGIELVSLRVVAGIEPASARLLATGSVAADGSQRE
jgi:hypothetical protein